MNDRPWSKEVEQMLKTTRGLVSRRVEAPPTPRDTMAVLRQAAEARLEAGSDRSWLVHAATRWGWATAVAAALMISGWLWFRTPEPARVAGGTIASVDDLGLDLTDWDQQIDVLLSEIDESIVSLTNDDVDALFNNGASWLEDSLL